MFISYLSIIGSFRKRVSVVSMSCKLAFEDLIAGVNDTPPGCDGFPVLGELSSPDG